MVQPEKLNFIVSGLPAFLTGLTENSTPVWGLMNPQQMVEHLADFFDVSYEKIVFPLAVPEDQLPKYRAFLYSDKEFRENTRAPASVLGDIPLPVRQPSLRHACAHLQISVSSFMEWFKDDPLKTSLHPVFGPLNYEDWIILHHKHVRHHLKQFRLMDS